MSNLTEVVYVRLLKNQRKRLEIYSKKSGLSLSGVIRQAVNVWLNIQEKS